MRAKFSRENLQDLLADPSSFRKGGEGEVIRVHFAKSCNREVADTIRGWGLFEHNGMQIVRFLIAFGLRSALGSRDQARSISWQTLAPQGVSLALSLTEFRLEL